MRERCARCLPDREGHLESRWEGIIGRTEGTSWAGIHEHYGELIEAAPDAVLVIEAGGSHYLLANRPSQDLTTLFDITTGFLRRTL